MSVDELAKALGNWLDGRRIRWSMGKQAGAITLTLTATIADRDHDELCRWLLAQPGVAVIDEEGGTWTIFLA